MVVGLNFCHLSECSRGACYSTKGVLYAVLFFASMLIPVGDGLVFGLCSFSDLPLGVVQLILLSLTHALVSTNANVCVLTQL